MFWLTNNVNDFCFWKYRVEKRNPQCVVGKIVYVSIVLTLQQFGACILNTLLQVRSRFKCRSTIISSRPKIHIPNHEWFTNPLVALLQNNSSTNY